jgi:glucose-1-phosphate cytidylyltransferase
VPPNETFAVTYGDGVSDVDLQKALAFHRSHGKFATVTGVRPPSRFGELYREGNKVLAFSEKPQLHEGLINGGFFFFEPAFLKYVSDEASCVLERDPLERAAADGQLMVYEHAGYWQCMDTYRDWESLEKQWQSGRAPWKVWSPG